jgi:UDP-2,4-diacetamido-2,4,6-trideoxy-beta-L-altropyranose hydrolase
MNSLNHPNPIKNRSFVFRVDASEEIGMGHLSRCVRVARSLKDLGIVYFILSECKPSLLRMLGEFSTNYSFIQRATELESIEPGRVLPKAAQQLDAEQTMKVLTGLPSPTMIVDHYGLDETWELMVMAAVQRLVVIDDLANRHHICNILIDQTLCPQPEARYHGLVGESAKLLLGPKYVILGPEFTKYKNRVSRDKFKTVGVLISVGSGQTRALLKRVIQTLSSNEFCHLRIKILSNESNRKILNRQTRAIKNLEVLREQNSLAKSMSWASVAIGAGGVTMLERLFMELPSLVTCTAPNQLEMCKTLEKQKLIRYLGLQSDVTKRKLAAAIRKVLTARKKYCMRTKNFAKIIDGLGARRIKEAISGLPQ